MCGIVGYIGPREAYPIVLKGLKRLEYRGYDSTGVAIIQDGNLQVHKKKGKDETAAIAFCDHLLVQFFSWSNANYFFSAVRSDGFCHI